MWSIRIVAAAHFIKFKRMNGPHSFVIRTRHYYPTKAFNRRKRVRVRLQKLFLYKYTYLEKR